MMKTIAGKVMWIGRATVFTIGLAVTLALMFGVTTAALAAVPGDPLKLGQVNAINALTTLVGTANHALLSIENNSPGSKGASAPALSLNVEQGNPPLVVNLEAGTATGLSADELDGKDSGAFASGTNGKADDADRLDGKDSAQFLAANGKATDADRLDGKDGSAFVSKIYLRQSTILGSGGGDSEVRQAFCDLGDKVLGGGGGSTANQINDHKDVVIKSQAQIEGPNDESWFVEARDNGVPSFITAQAICADLTP